jgi:hypothetical protein
MAVVRVCGEEQRAAAVAWVCMQGFACGKMGVKWDVCVK